MEKKLMILKRLYGSKERKINSKNDGYEGCRYLVWRVVWKKIERVMIS